MLAVLGSQLRRPYLVQTLPRAGYAAAAKAVKEIASEAEWNQIMGDVKKNSGGAIVQFTAQWCPPCKMIAPVQEEIAAKNPAIAFLRLDIDNQSLTPIVASHAVSAVPTFVSYRGDAVTATFTGADKAQLAAMVTGLGGTV